MHPSLRLVATLVCAALGAPALATAQSLASSSLPAMGAEAFLWNSPSMGVTYEIVVRTPPGAQARTGARHPALIVTDGYRTLLAAADAARSLEFQGTIEPLYIVSVGVPIADGDDAWTRRRIYEFSTAWELKDPFGKGVAGFCERFKSAPGKCVGGANAFLAMIVNEVIPQVAQRFPIDTAQLGLFGVSAGGFFASWAIFQEISPFKRYIINSPAMAYGEGEIFRTEARYAAAKKDLPISIFLATGSLELDDPYLEGIGLIGSGHARFGAALRGRNYPGLRFSQEILPGLGHGDATGASLVRGLRTLYSKH